MDFPLTEFFKTANSALGAPPRSSVAPALGVAALGGTAALLGGTALDGLRADAPAFTEDGAIQQYFDKIDRMPTFKPDPHQIY